MKKDTDYLIKCGIVGSICMLFGAILELVLQTTFEATFNPDITFIILAFVGFAIGVLFGKILKGL